MNFDILDERNVWFEAAIAAAERAGHVGRRIRRGSHALGPGIGFIRPHADPAILEQNQEDYRLMCDSGLTMIQDPEQVAVYEDKSAQWQFWGKWMPRTWRFCRPDDALHFIAQADCPEVLVSKADQGASSVNVRILKGRRAQIEHVERIFTQGLKVNPCSGGDLILQTDYVLLQEFIPHEITWRVNIVGEQMAGFKRYCYPDKPVAQTGNTDPIMEMDDEVASVFGFAHTVAKDIGTKWCAFDILRYEGGWKLLETSLAWPWPGVGKQAPFFGTNRHWGEMWDVMFDEFNRGVWHEG